jgi:hypothetical protein
MAKARPEKKPVASATRRVLPMELQVGDCLTDETGEWEIIGPAVHDGRREERSCPRPALGEKQIRIPASALTALSTKPIRSKADREAVL